MARRRKRKRQFFDEDDESTNEGSSSASVHFSPEIREQIESWGEEAAQAHGLELYDLDIQIKGRWIIRAYVEHPGEVDPGEGINVDECADVSRYLEAYLDAADEIPEDYVLEVSSPGVERPLKKPRHLRQAVGEKIQLIVREQIEGKNKVIGELVAYEDDTLTVRLEEGDGEPVDIDWENVKEARLKYDFDF